ncbi:MAG: hypothetical protein QOI74_445 [Micromonosporaceae bacterium]|nr:hypothetical protein [Micromonosporaceae bacterium]
MSNSHPTPKINSLVDLTLGGTQYLSRVESFDGPTVWVAAPLSGTVETPYLGSPVSLRWSAGTRGRYLAEASLRATDRPAGTALNRWNLSLDRPPVIDQRRQFVRAGGGELVVLQPRWSDALPGRVTNFGEGGLLCRLPTEALARGELAIGDPVGVLVRFDDESFTVDGWVLRVEGNRVGDNRVGADRPTHLVDVTVTYQLTDQDADRVRRYIMRQEMLTRRTAADAAR